MLKLSNIKIGCDPEIFVKKDGEFVTAHGLIKGNKRKPQVVDKGAVQVDGMALEFNTDPATSKSEFIGNVNTVFEQLSSMLPEGYEIVLNKVVADFDLYTMMTAPPEALELGCDPDFNGWTKVVNPTPNGNVNFRSAAGHIHIGYDSGLEKKSDKYDLCCLLARELDFYVGLSSIVHDSEQRRRELYGKAGAFRIKPYGVEYRTPSNFWLKSDELKGLIYDQVMDCIENVNKGILLSEKYGDIQNIINSGDVDSALEIIKNENLKV